MLSRTSAVGLLVPRVSSSQYGLFDICTSIYYWNLQFLNNVIMNKTKVLLPQAWVILADFGYLFYALGFYCSQNYKIICLSNLSKRVVCTKLGIYVFKLFCKTNINHKIYMYS
jgi:hypothetical protein